MDKISSKFIHRIEKNLVNCIDPRMHDKTLSGNLKGFWKYRAGDYRLFADIQNDVFIVETIKPAHQKGIYQQIKAAFVVFFNLLKSRFTKPSRI